MDKQLLGIYSDYLNLFVVIDDSIEEKLYTDENEFIWFEIQKKLFHFDPKSRKTAEFPASRCQNRLRIVAPILMHNTDMIFLRIDEYTITRQLIEAAEASIVCLTIANPYSKGQSPPNLGRDHPARQERFCIRRHCAPTHIP